MAALQHVFKHEVVHAEVWARHDGRRIHQAADGRPAQDLLVRLLLAG
jgi:hypothetical protein